MSPELQAFLAADPTTSNARGKIAAIVRRMRPFAGTFLVEWANPQARSRTCLFHPALIPEGIRLLVVAGADTCSRVVKSLHSRGGRRVPERIDPDRLHADERGGAASFGM